ncbi:hypothetical protein PTKIN_Ptkin15bG0065000 [Pterospermum kingtungense]
MLRRFVSLPHRLDSSCDSIIKQPSSTGRYAVKNGYKIATEMRQMEDFSELVFSIMGSATSMHIGKFLMIIWNIWRQWNEKLWNKKVVSSSQIVYGAMEVPYDWLHARELKLLTQFVRGDVDLLEELFIVRDVKEIC